MITKWTQPVGTAQVDDSTLHITELPVRKWTQDYKVRCASPHALWDACCRRCCC